MNNLKGVGIKTGLPEIAVAFVGGVKLLGETSVIGIGEHSLLIQKREDTHGFLLVE